MTNEAAAQNEVSPEAQVEAIRVIDEGLVAQRKLIADRLSDTYQALAAFIGDPEDGDAGTLIETTPAHTMIVACKVDFSLATDGFKIESAEAYEAAAGDLQKIKGYAKRVKERKEGLTVPARAADAAIRDIFRPAEGFLVSAEQAIKTAMLRYDDEQDKIRRAAEAVAAAEAKKEAEKLQARATLAESKGQTEKAAELQDRAASVAPVSVAVGAPVAVSGISKTTTYGVEVTDLAALVKAVSDGKVSIKALTADVKYLTGMAKLEKEDFNVPGVKLTKEAGISSRSK